MCINLRQISIKSQRRIAIIHLPLSLPSCHTPKLSPGLPSSVFSEEGLGSLTCWENHHHILGWSLRESQGSLTLSQAGAGFTLALRVNFNYGAVCTFLFLDVTTSESQWMYYPNDERCTWLSLLLYWEYSKYYTRINNQLKHWKIYIPPVASFQRLLRGVEIFYIEEELRDSQKERLFVKYNFCR